MTDQDRKEVRLPPRWFVRLAWFTHRGIYRVTGGRFGLWRPRAERRANRWGAMRLTTKGRRTGQKRSVILGYLEDGPNIVTMAMNGWADGEPAWWLNLQANPVARLSLPDGPRTVRGRAAEGEERSRLWAKWRELDEKLDAYAALRSSETAIVILEPANEGGAAHTF
jgi:F420H(2)-dependent quinone reductase